MPISSPGPRRQRNEKGCGRITGRQCIRHLHSGKHEEGLREYVLCHPLSIAGSLPLEMSGCGAGGLKLQMASTSTCCIHGGCRKKTLAIKARAVIQRLENGRWILIFTDGSAQCHVKVHWVAGYGGTNMGDLGGQGIS